MIQKDPRHAIHALLVQVGKGLLSIEEAESQALAGGHGPLLRQPDPADFDPMQEPFWSLPMVVAWIAWRFEAAVRDAWDDYRLKCEDWHYREYRLGPDAPMKKSLSVERRRPANLAFLAMSEVFDETIEATLSSLMTVHDARKALWRELQRGSIAASGVTGASGVRDRIQPETWCDLHAFVGPDDRDYLMTDPNGLVGLRYDALRFPSNQVLTVWSGKVDKDAPIFSTGAPGRPTSRHLVASELKRRAADQQLEASLAAEAQYLADWLAVAHPDAPPMRQKSVENALRSDYKSLKKP